MGVMCHSISLPESAASWSLLAVASYLAGMAMFRVTACVYTYIYIYTYFFPNNMTQQVSFPSPLLTYPCHHHISRIHSVILFFETHKSSNRTVTYIIKPWTETTTTKSTIQTYIMILHILTITC